MCADIGSTVSNASAVVVTRYAGPAPAPGSGPHRYEYSLVLGPTLSLFSSYVVLLYTQPATFHPPPAFSQPNIGVSTFDFNAYVQVCAVQLISIHL